jgi:hypothetical protein
MRTRHLHDDRLLECYAAERTGEPFDPPTAEHLAACDECGGRYTTLTQLLDTIRTDAEAEADELFTIDRLRQQQHQILHRIEHMGRQARVISFPGRIGRTIGGGSLRVAPRWLAAAAAVGLFVGVAVGGMFSDGSGRRRLSMTSANPQLGSPHPSLAAAGRAGVPAAIREVPDDDAFLSDLELALERPSTGELVPFDALTPHTRGISNQLR